LTDLSGKRTTKILGLEAGHRSKRRRRIPPCQHKKNASNGIKRKQIGWTRCCFIFFSFPRSQRQAGLVERQKIGKTGGKLTRVGARKSRKTPGVGSETSKRKLLCPNHQPRRKHAKGTFQTCRSFKGTHQMKNMIRVTILISKVRK
jgi:hypothetical protein